MKPIRNKKMSTTFNVDKIRATSLPLIPYPCNIQVTFASCKVEGRLALIVLPGDQVGVVVPHLLHDQPGLFSRALTFKGTVIPFSSKVTIRSSHTIFIISRTTLFEHCKSSTFKVSSDLRYKMFKFLNPTAKS